MYKKRGAFMIASIAVYLLRHQPGLFAILHYDSKSCQKPSDYDEFCVSKSRHKYPALDPVSGFLAAVGATRTLCRPRFGRIREDGAHATGTSHSHRKRRQTPRFCAQAGPPPGGIRRQLRGTFACRTQWSVNLRCVVCSIQNAPILSCRHPRTLGRARQGQGHAGGRLGFCCK